MKLYFRTLAIVMAALLTVYIVGCGGDDDDEPETSDAMFEVDGTSPAEGDIAANAPITVKFSSNPGDVTVSAGTVSTSGTTRTITAPDGGFPLGALALTIEWTNGGGSHTLNYNVVAADNDPPEVTGSSPEDGAEGVEPADVFEDGIEVTFSEDVTIVVVDDNDFDLMDGDDDVGWSSEASGNTITLQGNAGQELSNETEYTIEGRVKDGAGNEADVSLSFVTKAKE